MRWDFSHERGTTGDSHKRHKNTKATSGVQRAIASSKVSDMCRGDAPVPVLAFSGAAGTERYFLQTAEGYQ